MYYCVQFVTYSVFKDCIYRRINRKVSSNRLTIIYLFMNFQLFFQDSLIRETIFIGLVTASFKYILYIILLFKDIIIDYKKVSPSSIKIQILRQKTRTQIRIYIYLMSDIAVVFRASDY